MARHYFIEREVCWLLVQYKWTGCTSVPLRDAVMERADPLIQYVIRKNRLHLLCSNPDDIYDLTTTAWIQIEKCLYKFRAQPHCRACLGRNERNFTPTPPLVALGPRDYEVRPIEDVVREVPECPACGARLSSGPLVRADAETHGGSTTVAYKGVSKAFSLFTMIAITVCLAYMKQQDKDRKHSPGLERYKRESSGGAPDAAWFLAEARHFFRYDSKALAILADWENAIVNGLPTGVKSVAARLGVTAGSVTSFRRLLRALAHEFTDGPLEGRALRPHAAGGVEDDDS